MIRTAILLLLGIGVASGDEVTSVRAVRGDLSVGFRASGRIEPSNPVTADFAPRAWQGRSSLVEVVPAGTPVERGDVVFRFESTELEEAVADARFELDIAGTELENLLHTNRIAQEAEHRDIERREHAKNEADARRRMHEGHELPAAKARRKLDRESSEQALRNARDELAELLRMYEEDELVDETEKIVLDRQRFSVAYREALHDLTLRRLEMEEIREKEAKEGIDRAVREAESAHAKAVMEARISMDRRAVAERRARRAFDKRGRRMADLERDLEGMVVRAPVSGILLHGPVEGALERRFRAGQSVSPTDAVVTVVRPLGFVAVLRVPEKQVLALSVGQEARLTPSAEGAEAVPAVVAEVAALPESGAFRVVCRPRTPLPGALIGVGVEGRVETRVVEGALLIPLTAVHRTTAGAFVTRKGGERVPVTLGADDGTRVMVEAGLSEGDEITVGAATE